jgi:hypothetical protein
MAWSSTGTLRSGISSPWRPKYQQILSSSSAISSTTVVPVLNLSNLSPGWWMFEVVAGLLTNGTACTPGFVITGSLTTSSYHWYAQYNFNATSIDGFARSSGTTLPSSSSFVTLTPGLINTANERRLLVVGNVIVTSSGTLTAGFCRSSGGGSFTVRDGSIMRAWRTN